MKQTPLLLALLILIPQVASADVQIKMVKAYEVTKWEYFKVGIRNYGSTQKLTTTVRVYSGAGYESYRIIEGGIITYAEDGSAYSSAPVFSETISEWWEAGAYKEVLFRWVVSPCNCKRFIAFPILVRIEVYGANGVLLDSVSFVMHSEYFLGTG